MVTGIDPAYLQFMSIVLKAYENSIDAGIMEHEYCFELCSDYERQAYMEGIKLGVRLVNV